jgi:hypothetical protein
MIEGSVTFYKHFEIITDVKSGKAHVYNAKKEEVHVADKVVNAKIWILKSLDEWDISNLIHDGITIIPFLYNEKIYLISVLNEYISKAPNILDAEYFELNYKWGNHREIYKHFHNEKGPSNYCLETKESLYYWKGTRLSKEDWEKCIHEQKFTNTWNELMSGSD